MSCQKEKKYFTTAISYTNGDPHMGHAYESVITDVLARYHRVYGRDVFYLTGTDEHGQKIANLALSQNKQAIEICDYYSNKFIELNQILNTTSDFFIRTTSEKHKECVRKVYKKSFENGDIYIGNYEGWYNVREETYVTELEASLTNYKDSVTGKPLSKQNNESYFFRLSKYKDAIIQHIINNPDFIQPEAKKNEILLKLSDDLHDLSISRTNFEWGIKIPESENHVMYVWFDALVNYLSGINYFDNSETQKYWENTIHIVGKDITWFHCVIWPAILMSVGISLPKTIFSHGFVCDKHGKKMSKSIGNVVCPFDIVKKYGSDAFRYYVAKEAVLGSDLLFNESSLILAHNSDLANTIGNLAHRIMKLSEKYNDCVILDVAPEDYINVEIFKNKIDEYINNFKIRESIEYIMENVRNLNKYITDVKPWELEENKRNVMIRTELEVLYFLTHFLYPIIPYSCDKIFEKLNTKMINIQDFKTLNNMKVGTKMTVGKVLFDKIK